MSRFINGVVFGIALSFRKVGLDTVLDTYNRLDLVPTLISNSQAGETWILGLGPSNFNSRRFPRTTIYWMELVLEVGGPSRHDFKNFDLLNAGIIHPKGQEPDPKI
eukprot:TRINITY_DN41089_c0_g1_i1.p1 TRINITY_DN41089_c0_g1~~TRINITY_DN41089_c0_g1_i1.p1  ORF type:complete len:106 (+),score=6.16 TRINITY_DN41089_c0_g1_i1:512-829(+)